MDLTYDEYIDYLNSVTMQILLDFGYHLAEDESTVDSLTIL